MIQILLPTSPYFLPLLPFLELYAARQIISLIQRRTVDREVFGWTYHTQIYACTRIRCRAAPRVNKIYSCPQSLVAYSWGSNSTLERSSRRDFLRSLLNRRIINPNSFLTVFPVDRGVFGRVSKYPWRFNDSNMACVDTCWRLNNWRDFRADFIQIRAFS
jgi:hypothetical protein